VFVVRSGPSIERVKEVAPDPRWRNGRRFMVGYVGVIGQSEGLDLLVRGIEYMVRERRRDDVQFVIVGDGSEREAIIKMTQELRLENWITFTGRVSDATLFSVLYTADACVNPDRVTRMNDISTMNKIMEYMAFRKPIVQFDVKEGRRSALGASLYAAANDPFDFADKILHLLDDPDLRKSMGDFGATRLRDALAWHHQEPKLLQAYETIFASRKGDRLPLPATVRSSATRLVPGGAARRKVAALFAVAEPAAMGKHSATQPANENRPRPHRKRPPKLRGQNRLPTRSNAVGPENDL
jgi:glycosyltransferase involved in cell wall biosynthesis